MIRELRYAARASRRRPMLGLALWSVPEVVPAALSGLALAQAVDAGFLAGRPEVGLAWLGALVAAGMVGAAGSRMVFRRLSDVVEPVRDDLVGRVVGGALAHAVAGRPEDGAVSRLTRQVEIVRDTYAGLIMAVRGFLVTAVAATVGMLSLAPVLVPLLLPPFLLGIGLFLATLPVAAGRYRASVRADEQLAATAGSVLAGTRDLVANGAQEYALGMVRRPIATQAAAERSLAGVAALRTLCFLVGGWAPVVVLLLAGGWLAGQGLGAGALMGAFTYVLIGLQPALNTLISGLGASGLRFVVTLGRILDTSGADPGWRRPDPSRRYAGTDPARQPDPALPAERPRPRPARVPSRRDLEVRGLWFGYGPHAAPVLRGLDLTVPEGDHLAVVGPSGIGKSTLAGLLCGTLRPDRGRVLVGGVPIEQLTTEQRVACRVLIPQQAYVFTGSLRENLVYLRPEVSDSTLSEAVTGLGARSLVDRLGGFDAKLRPEDLSAGERQLVALVRSYLSAAPVAVLDEATCYLDPATEQRVERAFSGRGGTLIVVAHRVSSALRARQVLVFDPHGAGTVVGDHASLLATSPLYRELLGHWGHQPGPAGSPPLTVPYLTGRPTLPAPASGAAKVK